MDAAWNPSLPNQPLKKNKTESKSDKAADSALRSWALGLAATSKAFHNLTDQIGARDDDVPAVVAVDLDSSFDKHISLVMFCEDAGDAISALRHGEPDGALPDNVDGHDGCYTCSLQFVFWDDAVGRRGRRLTIESRRFKWIGPSRCKRCHQRICACLAGEEDNDDNLRVFFENDTAQILIKKVGATLVRAAGRCRTDIPKDTWTVYSILSAIHGKRQSASATHGDGYGDGEVGEDSRGAALLCQNLDKCNMCGKRAAVICPVCNNSNHDECQATLLTRCLKQYRVVMEADIAASDPADTQLAVAWLCAHNCGHEFGGRLKYIAYLDSTQSNFKIAGVSCLLCKTALDAMAAHGPIVFSIATS